MKFKSWLIVLLIATTGAAAAFASGSKESDEHLCGPRGRWHGPDLSEEKIQVTGEVYFEEKFRPILKSSTEKYELMGPPWYGHELDIEEGQTVTVEGYMAKGMPCCDEEDEMHLFVTKATVDGEEYELGERPFRHGGPMMGSHAMRGRRPGRGRGPR